MNNSNFEKFYKKLNKEQKEAVDNIDGPVMIIAGPGTGKTFTLTMRIANILRKTDTDPSSILALTFTDSGVNAMREKLIEIIGRDAYFVNILTFHSFCSNLISDYPYEFNFKNKVSILSDFEKIQTLQEIIDSLNLKNLTGLNDNYFHIKEIIKSIQDLKREGIDPETLKNLTLEEEKRLKNEELVNKKTGLFYTKFRRELKNIAKQKELYKIYLLYEKKLKEKGKIDFEDMINLVYKKFESNKLFKMEIQEKYLYILVDEYQDTNNSQNLLIKSLCEYWKDNPNIFVVGDDEQAIYRFQGASVENMIYFKNLFKNAKIITLKENYRSSQIIIDAARSLISKNLLKISDIEKKFESRANRENIPIQVINLKNNILETSFIVKKIKKLIKSGVNPREIAILTRKNRDLDAFQDELNSAGIKFELKQSQNILRNIDIRKLLLLFQVINEIKKSPNDDSKLFTLLNFSFWGLNKLDIYKLARFASKNNLNLFDLLLNETLLIKTNLSNFKKFTDIRNLLIELSNLDSNTTFIEFFIQAITKSGFLYEILSDKFNLSRIQALNRLYDEIKKLNKFELDLNLEKFLNYINILTENEISISNYDFESEIEAVQLITAHSAKGLEFDFVFIPFAIDKKWGNAREPNKIKLPDGIIKYSATEKKDKNEDERRLFYVALTRAKKEVIITYSNEFYDILGKRNTVMSMFLNEIDEKFKKEIKKTEIEPETIINFQKNIQIERDSLEMENEIMKKIIKNMSFSATTINSYCNCGYKFKIDKILKTPCIRSNSQAYGTAVHYALERFYASFKKNKKIESVKFLIQCFYEEMQKQIVSKKDRDKLLAKGENILKMFYKFEQNFKPDILFTEYDFSKRNVFFKDIRLSGKIDRIDIFDKEKKLVKVIDYKTGLKKSKNYILGKTKGSDLNYLNQLMFYKLLIDNDRNFNFKAQKGEFFFVESDEFSKPTRVEFDYSELDMEGFKKFLIQTVASIRNLEFKKTDDKKRCEDCPYNQHCWG